MLEVRPGKLIQLGPEVEYSKSFANRALILGAIKKDAFFIEGKSRSADVLSLISCLKKVGLDIEETEEGYVIKNSFPSCEVIVTDPIRLETGDGGTTNRFLLSLLSLGQNTYHLYPKEKMLKRPSREFLDVAKQGEFRFEVSEEYFLIKGPSRKKEVEVDCSKTTQFATGLLLSGYKVIPRKLGPSLAYYEMTKEMVNSQSLTVHVPLDWSSASYLMAYGALNGCITLPYEEGRDIFQADSCFVELLPQVGAEVREEKGKLVIESSRKLKHFDFDCYKAPDLVPTLIFLASYSEGISRFFHTDILTHKESDRLEEMKKILETFEITYEDKEGGLIIYGRSPHDKACSIETARDHRMVMVAYLFLRMNGGGRLYHEDCVGKSYPSFFRDFKA